MNYISVSHRRCYERFSVDGCATIIVDKEPGQPSILKDLSARGASVISNFPLNADTQLGIVIKASFLLRSPVYKKAKVVWCNKIDENLWQAGLDFGLDQLIKLC